MKDLILFVLGVVALIVIFSALDKDGLSVTIDGKTHVFRIRAGGTP